MAAVWWLLLLGTALSYTVMAEEQHVTMEEIQSEDNQELDSILPRDLPRDHGEVIRNILRRIEKGTQNDGAEETTTPTDLGPQVEDMTFQTMETPTGSVSYTPDDDNQILFAPISRAAEFENPALERISRHQHPGKILLEGIEKRQHPGKREDGEGYLDLPKRQHPGKREGGECYLELSKRQHPGKRSPLGDQYLDNPNTLFGLLSEVTKRQHPGKRSFPSLERISRHQHPGKILLEGIEKRQHPGKREDGEGYLELSGKCGLLPGVTKRQHPGKRSFPYTKRQHPGKRNGEDEENTKDGVPEDIEKRQHPGKRLEEKRQHPGRRDVWDEKINDAQE